MREDNELPKALEIAIAGIALSIAGLLIIGVVALPFWALPQWNVYNKNMSGQAQLREAEHNRQIAIEEAKAHLHSAKFLSDAEVERARGVAEANQIIGESLQDNEAYLRYLWIQGLHNGSSETIYIPTEANLPVLEATRRDALPVPQE